MSPLIRKPCRSARFAVRASAPTAIVLTMLTSAVVMGCAGTLSAVPKAGQQVVATALPRARADDVGLSAEALARIAPALRAYTDAARLPGIVFAVARHGKLVQLDAVGFMDIKQRTPMRTDAIFRIFSMTKAVTGAAVAQLIERGKIRLDDPVSKYIPAFASVRVYVGGPAAKPTLRPPTRPITIVDLLTHSAGLTYGSFGNSAVDSIYRAADLLAPTRTIAQFADSIARLPLIADPGTRWNYSMAMDVLGRVVEVASGRTFDRYLTDELFMPLGMRETGFHATPAMQGRIATIYTRGANGALVPDATLIGPGYREQDKVFAGGQGLLSSASDYLRFAQMLLNGGTLDGRRVLKPESVALMMRNHLPPGLSPITPPPLGSKRGYGQGFGGIVMLDSVAAGLPTSPGEYQWCGYAGTYFWIDRARDLIGMVWTQVYAGCPHPVEPQFQKLVYGAIVGR